MFLWAFEQARARGCQLIQLSCDQTRKPSASMKSWASRPRISATRSLCSPGGFLSDQGVQFGNRQLVVAVRPVEVILHADCRRDALGLADRRRRRPGRTGGDRRPGHGLPVRGLAAPAPAAAHWSLYWNPGGRVSRARSCTTPAAATCLRRSGPSSISSRRRPAEHPWPGFMWQSRYRTNRGADRLALAHGASCGAAALAWASRPVRPASQVSFHAPAAVLHPAQSPGNWLSLACCPRAVACAWPSCWASA